LSALGVLRKNPELFSPALPAAKPASMKNLVFGVVNKIFLSYEAPFLNPEISEIIVLWNKIDESATPMAERWFRKIYSFCKGDFKPPRKFEEQAHEIFFIQVCNIILVFSL
jgi:spermine oxidase